VASTTQPHYAQGHPACTKAIEDSSNGAMPTSQVALTPEHASNARKKTRFLKFAGALSYWDSDHSVVRQMHTMQTQSRHRYPITYTHELITLAEQYASMRWHAARRLGSSETRRRIVSLGGWRSSQALVGRRHVTGGTTCMTAQRIKTTITF
jgi:hypothetical protein